MHLEYFYTILSILEFVNSNVCKDLPIYSINHYPSSLSLTLKVETFGKLLEECSAVVIEGSRIKSCFHYIA